MWQLLRQAWWAPFAALLIVGQLAIAAVFVFDTGGLEESTVGASVALGGALLLVAGLGQRPHARVLGSILLIIGCVAAAFWFWSLIMPIVAIVVMVGVIISWLRAPTPTTAATAEL